MKVKRRGAEVELRRNKRRGLKLMIRDCSLNHDSCKYCYLNSPHSSRSLYSVCALSMVNPCDEAGLLGDEYFIHKK
jgi:hypothetical protein